MTVTRPASAGARRTWPRPAPPCRAGTAAAPGTAPAPQRRGGKRQARAAAAAIAVAALAAAGVTGRAALTASSAVLGHLHWIWIPAAVAGESASMAAFAIMLRRLLAAGGASVGVRPMLATAPSGPGGRRWPGGRIGLAGPGDSTVGVVNRQPAEGPAARVAALEGVGGTGLTVAAVRAQWPRGC